MPNKYEIIKTMDISNDLVIILAKKVPEKIKHCKDCPHFKYFGDLSLHYCDKHKGVVEKDDVCIEVMM